MRIEAKRIMATTLALHLASAPFAASETPDFTSNSGNTAISDSEQYSAIYDGRVKLTLTLTPDGEQIETKGSTSQVLDGDIIGLHREYSFVGPGRNIAQADIPAQNSDRVLEVDVRTDISAPEHEQKTMVMPLEALRDAEFVPVLGAPYESPIDNIGDTIVNDIHGGVYLQALNPEDQTAILNPNGEPIFLRQDQVLLNVPEAVQAPIVA